MLPLSPSENEREQVDSGLRKTVSDFSLKDCLSGARLPDFSR